jgi:hypothetical protein
VVEELLRYGDGSAAHSRRRPRHHLRTRRHRIPCG